jgi:tRNA A37 threonylcarbamoyladenosine dehydratase
MKFGHGNDENHISKSNMNEQTTTNATRTGKNDSTCWNENIQQIKLGYSKGD